MKLSNIVIISGPSGAGEDSVIDGLSKLVTIHRVITTSTREPRPGESDGNPYHFVTESEFNAKIAAGEMIEWAREYNNHLYGVTLEELQRVATLGGVGVWKMEYKGVQTAKKMFPEIVAIMITADLDVLEARIRRRDKVTEEHVATRMEYTKEWFRHKDIYDYIVENKEGKLDETIQNVMDIMRKEQYL